MHVLNTVCGLCAGLVAVENYLLEACVLSSLSFDGLIEELLSSLPALSLQFYVNQKQLDPNLKAIVYELRLERFISVFTAHLLIGHYALLWDKYMAYSGKLLSLRM